MKYGGEGEEKEERERREEREEERRRRGKGWLIHLPSIYPADPGRRPLAGALLPQCCTAGGATKPVSFTGEEVVCETSCDTSATLCSTVL